MGRRKKLIIIIAVIVILPIYFFFFFQQGIILYDTFLLKHQTGDQTEYSGKIYGYNSSILVKKTNEDFATITFLQENTLENYTIECNSVPNEYLKNVSIYQNNKVIFEGKYNSDENEHFRVFNGDGSPYLDDMVRISTNGMQEKVEGLTVHEIVKLFCEDDVIRGNAFLMLLAFGIILIWVIDMCYPKFFFLLRYYLYVDNPEPSDCYLNFQHISWVISPIISAILLLCSLF